MRLPTPWLVASLLGLGFAAQAMAGPAVGVAFDANLNRADESLDHAELRNGLGLRVPVRVPLSPSAALRVTTGARIAPGSDRVVWSQDDTRVYADVADAAFVAGELKLGPELMPGAGALRPYFGADVGVILAWNFHALEGAAAGDLLDSGASGDPFTRQLAPAAGLHGGMRWKATETFAMEVEAGYNFSFLQEVELRNAPADLDAMRAAYGWTTIRVGLGATFLLGNGTNP